MLPQSTKWKIIRITSMEVDFWGVKSSGCENSQATEVLTHSSEKLNFIPQKKRNERQSRRISKMFRLPFLISQQKRLFDQNSFTIQMSLEIFQSNGNESRKLLIFVALTFISLIFRYEFLYAKYVDLLDKLREVKKSLFFSTLL
jgi:hypothetical protein